jgi:hypothetical protein
MSKFWDDFVLWYDAQQDRWHSAQFNDMERCFSAWCANPYGSFSSIVTQAEPCSCPICYSEVKLKKCECNWAKTKSTNNAPWYDFMKSNGYPTPTYCCFCGKPLMETF